MAAISSTSPKQAKTCSKEPNFVYRSSPLTVSRSFRFHFKQLSLDPNAKKVRIEPSKEKMRETLLAAVDDYFARPVSKNRSYRHKNSYYAFWSYIAVRLRIKELAKKPKYSQAKLSNYNWKADLKKLRVGMTVEESLTEFYSLYRPAQQQQIKKLLEIYEGFYGELYKRLYKAYYNPNAFCFADEELPAEKLELWSTVEI